MRTAVNETTGVLEGFLKGTIVSINDSDVKTNSNGKQYKKAIVNVEYPDGSTQETQSVFYTKAQEALPSVYAVGQRIELAVQLEGEYAGNSVMQAPQLARIDLTKLGVVLTPQAQPAPAITA